MSLAGWREESLHVPKTSLVFKPILKDESSLFKAVKETENSAIVPMQCLHFWNIFL